MSGFSFPFEATADDAETCRRIVALAGRAGGAPIYTKFLDGREQTIARYALESAGHKNYIFHGGRPGGERAVLAIYGYPFGEAEIDGLRADFPIVALHIKGSGYTALSHRDYLGSILATGIKREFVGDIITGGEHAAAVFICAEIAPYLISNLETVGRDKVRVEYMDSDELANFGGEKTVEPITGHVASLRIDSIVAVALNLSREKAKDALRAGIVSVNHMPVTSHDRQLNEGDLISVRGAGRFELASAGGLTRKGNVKVVIHKYV